MGIIRILSKTSAFLLVMSLCTIRRISLIGFSLALITEFGSGSECYTVYREV